MLTSGEKITIEHTTVGDTVLSSLELREVDLPDAGEYVCVAENDVGSDTASAVLGVDGKGVL